MSSTELLIEKTHSAQFIIKLNFPRGLLSLSYPAIFVHSNYLRSLTRMYTVQNQVSFCANLELHTFVIMRP